MEAECAKAVCCDILDMYEEIVMIIDDDYLPRPNPDAEASYIVQPFAVVTILLPAVCLVTSEAFLLVF